MKPFKILKVIFQAVAAVAFLASYVICSLDITVANTAFMTVGGTLFVVGTVGTLLIGSGSDTAKRIGHGMTISTYAIGLTAALTVMDSATEEGSTAATIMIVAAVALALFYLCTLILKIMQKNAEDPESPEDDVRIIHVREWKKIMDEGIISAEEYEAKRCQILGIKQPEKKPEDKPVEGKPAPRA